MIPCGVEDCLFDDSMDPGLMTPMSPFSSTLGRGILCMDAARLLGCREVGRHYVLAYGMNEASMRHGLVMDSRERRNSYADEIVQDRQMDTQGGAVRRMR